MREADALCPLLLGGGGVVRRQRSRRLPGQRRTERMPRRPPHFGRQVVRCIAQRLDGHRKQNRLAHAADFRAEALLARLRPERGEIGRNHHTGDDLGLGFLEAANLRRKIVRQVLVAARIDQLVALRGQRLWQPPLRIAPCIAVTIIREQTANDLVGGQQVPHAGENANDVLQTPEIVPGVLESDIRLATAREEPRLPRCHGGDAGNFVHLALVRHRIGCFGRRGHQHQVDVVGLNQAARHFGGAVGAGLAVPQNDFHRALARLGHHTVGQHRLQLGQRVGVRFAKRGERAGLRADHADLDGLGRRTHRAHRAERCECGHSSRA